MSVPRTDEAEPRLADAVLALPGWAHRVRAYVLARDGRLQSSWGKVTELALRETDGPSLAGARSQNSHATRAGRPQLKMGQGRAPAQTGGIRGSPRAGALWLLTVLTAGEWVFLRVWDSSGAEHLVRSR